MTDLHKLKIDKHQKARRDEKPVWPWLLVLFLIAGGAVAAYQYQQASAATPVETFRVRAQETAASSAPGGGGRSNDLVVLNATGYIMAAHKIQLASKVIGRVAWVGVEMGDKVEKGQVLVRLEDDEFKARVAQMKGQLDAAKARLDELEAGNRPQEIAAAQAQLDRAVIEMENAQRVFKRLTDIRTGRTTSQNEIDDAEALMKARKAQVDFQQHQLDLLKAGTRKEQIAAQRATVAQLEGALSQSQIDLDNTIIRAPLTATILERNVEAGEFVTTGFVGDRGAKGFVVSIADLTDLLVDLDISQNNFAKVANDQPCFITTDAYPDRKYPGKVERISPVANRQKATVQVRVQVLNPDGLLKPDMNATVSFLAPANAGSGGGATQPGAALAAATTAFRIPATALKNNAVFIVEDGKAVRLPVTPGMSTASGDIEITKGLRGGEDLILNPPETLKEGDRVEPRKP